MEEDFPYIKENQRIQFPGEDDIDESGIAGVGGNLSPGILLSAYEQGIFPWYGPDEPIIWWNPSERAVFLPGELHISQSMKRFLKRTNLTVTYDQDFYSVIRSCREIERSGQDGTWITDEMLDAYCELHRLGYAHSVEVWDSEYSSDKPAGGLYGLHLGKAFFGESMFSYVPNASKTALITLYRHLMDLGMTMIDCQVMNDHLISLGAVAIPRPEYMKLLHTALGN
jgi:leucyl/phenylalanyl-tRNA---protein transferase